MTNFALKALEFGVLGLCAITLVLVWRVLQAEQKREGHPRKGILQASYVFMSFCLALALLNGFVQLSERQVYADAAEEIRATEDKLLRIRSAADPILNARVNILERLPAGSERDTLMDLLESLREILE